MSWHVQFNSCGEVDPRCRGGYRVEGPEYATPHGFRDKADADLIAAAPELLKALKDVLTMIAFDDLIPESVSYMKQARAAIAKAEGR